MTSRLTCVDVQVMLNPRATDLSVLCPQLNAASLFGVDGFIRLGYPDIHPTVSIWGHDTYVTGWVVIGSCSAIYPGCNFMGDAKFPLVIGSRSSLQHVELHYSGFRGLPTIIGDDCFLSHLAFGHSVRMGHRCYVLGHATMLDGAIIEDDVFIEANSTILGDAVLKAGYAYRGIVTRDTEPFCRTTDVIFGKHPETGVLQYIGGERGVRAAVNASHCVRNDNQMRAIAHKAGIPEHNRTAHGVRHSHVLQTAVHYLATGGRLLQALRSEGAPVPVDAEAACQQLCAVYRAFLEGHAMTGAMEEAWRRRGDLVAEIEARLGDRTEPVVFHQACFKDDVIFLEEDIRTLVRKVVESVEFIDAIASGETSETSTTLVAASA